MVKYTKGSRRYYLTVFDHRMLLSMNVRVSSPRDSRVHLDSHPGTKDTLTHLRKELRRIENRHRWLGTRNRTST